MNQQSSNLVSAIMKKSEDRKKLFNQLMTVKMMEKVNALRVSVAKDMFNKQETKV